MDIGKVLLTTLQTFLNYPISQELLAFLYD
jgi:hypothetical protein